MAFPSDRLAAHFHLRLAPEVVEWFDGAPHKTNCAFNERIPVDRVLNPHSSAVWGGQMLPDTLPFLGNGGGDKLCLRFNADGTLREIIRWNHEDGSWLPCGESIASALAYVRMLEGKDPGNGNVGLSRAPALHLKARQCLRSGLHAVAASIGGQRIAGFAEMSWMEFRARAFDPSGLLPEACRRKIAAELSRSPAELFSQDWVSAAAAASEVIALRPDLAWPFAVAGWALERQGRVEKAVQVYARGVWSLDTTADFTSQWGPPPQHGGKYCVQALLRLKPSDIASETVELLEAAGEPDGIRTYWSKRAELAESQGRYREAYDFLYRAGWDEYCTDRMGEFLDGLISFATAAQTPALAALAAHHGSAM